MKKIKLYAKQVSPSLQDCDYLWNDIQVENIDKVCITGNRDYIEVTTEEYDTFVGNIDNVDNYILLNGEVDTQYYDTFEDFVNDYFYTSAKSNYNEQELEQWKKLFVDYLNDNVKKDEDFICRGLTMMTGKEYDYWTIRGYCQDDWNILYAPKGIDKDYYEKVYFNLGTEWQLSYDENFEDCFYCYSFGDNKDDIKKDIAKREGCEVDEIKMYKWVGQHYVDDYEEC